jgi:hypothetical protein
MVVFFIGAAPDILDCGVIDRLEEFELVDASTENASYLFPPALLKVGWFRLPVGLLIA